MANYASTVLQAARAKQIESYAKRFEGRPENSYLMDMFLKTRTLTIPALDDIRQATTQTTSTLYLTKTAYTVGSAKSCSPSGEQGDSGSVDLTWNTKSVEVITSEKRHHGNEYKMVEALAWELLMAEQALWKDGAASMEVALLAYLEANRTQVNALSSGTTGSQNTWDGVNFNVDVALADIPQFYNNLVDDMALNNYTGKFLEAHNTTWGGYQRNQANQGEANATNTQYQYQNPFDFEGFPSNLITLAAGENSEHYIVPEYGIALLDWNDPVNREGKVSGEKEWSLYESRFFPGVMLDLFTVTACADTSASGGGTQDHTIVYELSFNYAATHQPLSTTNETPIFKYNTLTT
jgi:hypothetical protein